MLDVADVKIARYEKALRDIIALFENEDFLDEMTDVLEIQEIAERALE
jgi:hypothetical protein